MTGGNSGIGKAIALAFAREGAKVIVAARRIAESEGTVDAIRKSGGEAIFVKADVSKTDEVRAMVEACVSQYGKLDYAINNAGILGSVFTLTAEYEEDVWDNVMDTNLKGVWLCMKYQIPQMLKCGKGVIVNMSSVAGLRGGRTGIAYYASKHGVVGMTKAAAYEYAREGLRINAVCPAVIETPMIEGELYDEERLAKLKAIHPVGRFGQPEEVASAVLWLCSDGASFMTGHALPVDGGLMI